MMLHSPTDKSCGVGPVLFIKPVKPNMCHPVTHWLYYIPTKQ